MSDDTPTDGALPGEQWKPSNGTDGACMIDEFCSECARDRVMNGEVAQDDATDDDYCPILGASFRGEAVEWRELPDGSVTCIAFVPAGERIPAPRCTRTADLFPEARP